MAPTLAAVLTRKIPRSDMPDIPAPLKPMAAEVAPVPDQPLNSIQKAIIAASVAKHRGIHPADPTVRDEVGHRVKTVGDAFRYLSYLL